VHEREQLLLLLRRYVANDHVHGGCDELTQEAEDFLDGIVNSMEAKLYALDLLTRVEKHLFRWIPERGTEEYPCPVRGALHDIWQCERDLRGELLGKRT